MAWIELHQSLFSHRKTQRAAEALKIDPVTMVGHLASLWCWCLDNAPDGDLTDISFRILSNAAQWRRDPNVFVAALTGAGFIDGDGVNLTLHDWLQYAGKLIDQRKRNAERQAAFRERNRYVTVTSSLRNGATVPNPTVPNLITITANKSSSKTTNVGVANAPSPQAPAAASKTSPKEITSEFIAEMAGKFPTLDVPQELDCCRQWCAEHKKGPPGRLRLMNWLKNGVVYKEQQNGLQRRATPGSGGMEDIGLPTGTKRGTGGVEGGAPRVESYADAWKQ